MADRLQRPLTERFMAGMDVGERAEEWRRRIGGASALRNRLLLETKVQYDVAAGLADQALIESKLPVSTEDDRSGRIEALVTIARAVSRGAYNGGVKINEIDNISDKLDRHCQGAEVDFRANEADYLQQALEDARVAGIEIDPDLGRIAIGVRPVVS